MMTRWVNLLVLAIVVLPARGADWRQFRGSDSSGVAAGDVLPEQFGLDKNLAWKAELPGRGLSAPVVVGNRVFLTASAGPQNDRLSVLGFDTHTGRKLWHRTFWATGPTRSHPKTCMAAPTPASDGRFIVALFGTDDLVCLDLDGNVVWVRSLYEENPGATDARGLASSLLIVGATVVVQIECQNTSFAAGIDIETGENRWSEDRPHVPCWSSPILLPGKTPAEPLILLQGSTRLSACDPMTGQEVWSITADYHPIASSVLAGKVLYVPANKGLTALEIQSGKSPPKVLWEQPRLSPSVASPVVVGDRIYVLRGSVLVTGNTRTGAVLGQLRLKGAFSSTPVSAGGLLYCFSEDGLAQVAKPGDKDGTLVGSYPFKETILCTPAIANGALYVRSDRTLWKIAKS
jgi:outer membrane protein assembly factor BamB